MLARLVSPWRGAARSLTLSADTFAAVTTPTLVLWGADDNFADVDAARALVAALPDADLEVVPDAGHLPWLDDPALFAQRIRAHLSAVAAG